jgi:uroporphyrinogen decarboxylase
MKERVGILLDEMKPYPNYVLSSGCDVPPVTPLTQIDAFFEALEIYNSNC